jgi:NADH-quinone oxidoreductase subunit N
MLSITSYVLAGFLKKERRSSEAALKYLVYGALSSGVMVFGFSILFGMVGSLKLSEVGGFVAGNMTGEYGAAVTVATVMVLMGFCFKIAAFPFHFWCPDVYEGAPTPVTTFLAVCSKAAGFGLILRFVNDVFIVGGDGGFGAEIAFFVGILSAVTMTYGNITAIKQDNLKRLLAYSSIAHAGYLLMGVAAFFAAMDGAGKVDAVVFYLIAYLIMNLGAFGVVIYLANRFGRETIEGYKGLGWRAPYCCGFMVIFLLSLTGIPPTIGFIGKWKLFVAVIDQGMYWLAVVAAVNSVVALFYYFRIAKALFFESPAEGEIERQGSSVQGLFVVLLCVLGVAAVYYGVYWNGIEVATRGALP